MMTSSQIPSREFPVFKVVVAANLVLILALGYGLFSMNGTLEDRIAKIESANQQTQSDSEENKRVL